MPPAARRVIPGSGPRLGLGLLAAVACFAAAARAEGPKTWHAETLTSSPRGLQVTQYWSGGVEKLRAETVIAGHRFVTIVNGEIYYSIDATTGQAIAVKRTKRARADSSKRERLVGIEGFVIEERGGEKVKEEPLAGRMCDVYRLTDSDGKREVWVQQDKTGERLPLRVDVYNRVAATRIRTDYVQWSSGLVLPERLFLPDPRFEVQELAYDEYVKRSGAGETLVPVLHANLLHGER